MTKALLGIVLFLFLNIPVSLAQTSAGEAAPLASPLPASTGSVEKTGIEKTTTESKNSRYASKTEAVRIPRFEAAPVIDGRLDDAVWQAAAIFGDFCKRSRAIIPRRNIRPRR
jgi:hypothetical protein